MRSSCNQPIVDLYPIVVDLDEATLENGANGCSGKNSTTSGSLYDAVALEVSWFESERSRMREECGQVDAEIVARENDGRQVGSPTRRQRKVGGRPFLNNPPPSPVRNKVFGPSHRNDCDDEWNGEDREANSVTKLNSGVYDKSSLSGGVFSNLRSMLGGSHRNNSTKHKHTNMSTNGIKTLEQDSVPEGVPYSNVASVQSLGRVGIKRSHPRRFHDEYVLTQQIVRCRISTQWECVHRSTGRRYCVKAIDKRRFTSLSDREMAVREIAMHRLIHKQTPLPSCIPRMRDIFADEEASEPMQHEECCIKSSASVCSGSTVSVSSQSACDESNHNNYWYMVQDFEAGGGNLELYLQGSENAIVDVLEKVDDNNGGKENNINSNSNPFHAIAETSRAASKIMQESEVRSLARYLLLALNELHSRSICHNDLCPENILVPNSTITRQRSNERESNEAEGDRQRNQHNDEYISESYRHTRHRRSTSHHDSSSDDCWQALKLCDLGRAFAIDQATAGDGDDAEDPITEGDVTGEIVARHSYIYYTSPEVILGNPPSLASDMWSIGVVLYRCFAGELPFREHNEDNACLAYSSTPESSFASTTSTEWDVRQQIVRGIYRGDCHLSRSCRRNADRRWSRISRDAKQFLSALLHPVPDERMTCDEALLHPWLRNGAIVAVSSSSPLIPIVPSSTSTNHYHHHPLYSAMQNSNLEDDANSEHDHNHNRTLLSTDDFTAQINVRPKSFLHRLFGRFRSSNSNDTIEKVSNAVVEIEVDERERFSSQ